MFYKFWMWLLGFKEDESGQQDKQANQSFGSGEITTGEDEGNFRSGPDGYEGGGYEGR